VCAVGSGPHKNMATTTKQKVQRAILYAKYKISLTFFVPEKRFLLSSFSLQNSVISFRHALYHILKESTEVTYCTAL